MILALYEHPEGVQVPRGNRVVYDVARNEAYFGAAAVEGRTLVWELAGRAEPGARLVEEVEPAPLMRCDRVDFPPGGIAYRHTHPGPGIRYLLHGSIRIETGGSEHTYGPGDAWFEPGPEAVLAHASEAEETAFVRVMLLPQEWAGRRTISYVDPADEEKPKLQRATVFLEASVDR